MVQGRVFYFVGLEIDMNLLEAKEYVRAHLPTWEENGHKEDETLDEAVIILIRHRRGEDWLNDHSHVFNEPYFPMHCASLRTQEMMDYFDAYPIEIAQDRWIYITSGDAKILLGE